MKGRRMGKYRMMGVLVAVCFNEEESDNDDSRNRGDAGDRKLNVNGEGGELTFAFGAS